MNPPPACPRVKKTVLRPTPALCATSAALPLNRSGSSYPFASASRSRYRPRASHIEPAKFARRVDHVPLRPLQDADDPATATRYVPVDHGSHRVSPGQIDQRAAGWAGRIGFHTPIIEVAAYGPRVGISKQVASSLGTDRTTPDQVLRLDSSLVEFVCRDPQFKGFLREILISSLEVALQFP